MKNLIIKMPQGTVDDILKDTLEAVSILLINTMSIIGKCNESIITELSDGSKWTLSIVKEKFDPLDQPDAE